ncbi:TPA: recombination-associated protein RdgC, partial [Mannheimia haemolytica]|nr:recombination-associated protein RdgC [Mannheimia haemolytica]
MVWFKNVMIYKLTGELALESNSLNELQQETRFTPCSQHDMSKFGWATPLTGSDLLHFSQANQFLLISHKEDKLLPANVVKAETEQRIAELEEKEARKLKKTEKQAVKDQIVSALLPRAFSKHQFTA